MTIDSRELPESPLEQALASVRTETIEQQLERWNKFAGSPVWLELQALKIRGESSMWESSRYAHADDIKTAARLATTADKWHCPAVYMIANPIASGVASRSTPGQWHNVGKGDGTSDAEIACRSVLFVDIDAKRPKGTSATNAEIAETIRVCKAVYDAIIGVIEDHRPIGVGDSGNGRGLFLALDMLNVVEAGKRHHAILLALDAQFTDNHVKIDCAVHDAKRLIPCWGTVKKKGAPGIDDRPHRKTVFWCDADFKRLSIDDLDRILTSLREGLSDEVQREIDRALGIKPTRTGSANTDIRNSIDSPFKRANEVPISDVLSWLGLIQDGNPVCPGCGISDGTSVAIVGNGVKCSHARCADRGYRDGFRTVVDVVCEAKALSNVEAVKMLADRFGFEGFHFRDPTPNAQSNGVQKSTAPAAKPKRARRTPSHVIDDWRIEGPLVHVSTGLAKLDEVTGGGPVFGTRWIINGAPDSGKTALLVQLAHVFMDAGLVVGYLAVDEEEGDLMTRILQRRGWRRRECETRDKDQLDLMADAISELPLCFFDVRDTIESAAQDTADFAKERNARGGVLLVDSVQTVECEAISNIKAANKLVNPYQEISANVFALRNVAKKYRLIAIGASEMNRSSYRSSDARENTSGMASGSGSGKIEFQARVLLSMRSMKDEPDMIEVTVDKNKHGPANVTFHLDIDRRLMILSETESPEIPDRREERAERQKATAIVEAGQIAVVVSQHQGIGTREIARLLRLKGQGMADHRIADGLATLDRSALDLGKGKKGSTKIIHIDGRLVPEPILQTIADANERAAVVAARHPPPPPETQQND